ncbi:cytochrome B [Henriciella mobilis]|uniref:cytochrome b/b6 domain-containing protein n=1 Tax=Henriciella mobilis TaxID=2305467 RepID=UPI000E660DD3|nr:cytochrome b/b6 domain-containing protein [Henriciella mobilis]RIJ16612.1 cytochrome B [Henriciella mobilis]RIJ20186.1 cytochrome B [Henriciella mobilis]
MNTEEKPKETVRVWDPVVRIGHWAIVIAFFIAYLSGDEFQGIHHWAGYTVASLVVIRLVWGLLGTRHARFSSFVTGPRAVFRYLRGLMSGKADRHLGHNPAGAAMIIALLLSLAGTTLSGMSLLAVEDGRGPLAGVVATQQSSADPVRETRSYSDDDENDHEYGDDGSGEVLETVHSAFTYLTLGLVALHILGVVASSFAHRENLVRAMFTGRKKPLS